MLKRVLIYMALTYNNIKTCKLQRIIARHLNYYLMLSFYEV